MAAAPPVTTDNRGTREVTAAVVRSAWEATQEWTAAWKVGLGQLRMMVDGLEGLGLDSAPEKRIHEAAKKVYDALVKMVSSSSSCCNSNSSSNNKNSSSSVLTGYDSSHILFFVVTYYL